MSRISSSSTAQTSTALPKAVWLLSWVSFFADVSGEMIYPLLPLYVIGVLGSNKTQLGAMEGAAVLIVALMSAFAGFRSDRKGKGGGRVPWIRWGYGLPVLGKSLIAVAQVWPMVFGGRLLDRFGKGLRGAPRDALIADAVTAEQRGRAFGMHRAFDTAGALLGVLLAAFLLWWLTGSPQKEVASEGLALASQTPPWIYRTIFGVGAALGLASLILTFLVAETASPAEPQQKTAAGTLATTPFETSNSTFKTGFLSFPAKYWVMLVVLILFSLANSSDTFLLLHASDHGFSSWGVVMLYAVYNITYSALSYPAGALSDRLGRWQIMTVGWLLYAAVYAGFALLPVTQAWGLWPLMALYGVYMALTEGVGKALIADHAPRESRGAAMGLFYALTGGTTFGASLLAGVIWDHYGSSSAFMLGAVFALLALLALPLVRQNSK